MSRAQGYAQSLDESTLRCYNIYDKMGKENNKTSALPPHVFKIDNQKFSFDPWSFELVTPEGRLAVRKRAKWSKAYRPEEFFCLSLDLTQRCNLDCPYCYLSKSTRKRGKQMDQKTAFQAVDFLLENSTQKNVLLIFFGAEPFLNWQVLKKTVAYAKRSAKAHNKKINFSFTTNGSLLDPEKNAFLKEQDIQGMISSDQRPSAGKKSSAAELPKHLSKRRIRSLKLTEIAPVVRISIAKQNIKGLAETVKYYAGLGFMVNADIVVTDNPGSALDGSDLTRLSKEYLKIYRFIAADWARGGRMYPHCLGQQVQAIFDRERVKVGCGAGVTEYTVGVAGEIFMCNDIFRIGDLASGKVDRGLARSMLSGSEVESKQQCAACWAKYLCGGGCFFINYKYHGSLQAVDPVFCRSRKMILEYALALAARVRKVKQFKKILKYHKYI